MKKLDQKIPESFHFIHCLTLQASLFRLTLRKVFSPKKLNFKPQILVVQPKPPVKTTLNAAFKITHYFLGHTENLSQANYYGYFSSSLLTFSHVVTDMVLTFNALFTDTHTHVCEHTQEHTQVFIDDK